MQQLSHAGDALVPPPLVSPIGHADPNRGSGGRDPGLTSMEDLNLNLLIVQGSANGSFQTVVRVFLGHDLSLHPS